LQAAPVLVINTTELRTGSAFRFGTIESESWRSGKLHKNDVKVAHAPAASAAFRVLRSSDGLQFCQRGERAKAPLEKIWRSEAGRHEQFD
jgi:hypothetical protein